MCRSGVGLGASETQNMANVTAMAIVHSAQETKPELLYWERKAEEAHRKLKGNNILDAPRPAGYIQYIEGHSALQSGPASPKP